MTLLDFTFDERIAHAATLPARCYHEPAYLAAEYARVFHRTWQLVGRLAQLPAPGSYFTAEVGREPLVVVRDAGGELRAFHNVCRHRAGLVVQGAGHCAALRCGYHGWTYGLDGRLLGAPDFEGVADFDRREMGLKPIRVETWEQFIFVRIAEADDAPSLADLLGDIPAEVRHCRVAAMRFAARRDYVLECNWKVYVDNYVEGYHIPMVHPSLMRELDYQRYRTVTHRYHSRQDAPIKTGDDPQRHYSANAEQRDARYFWVFPNLMLNVYPDNLSTNLIVPLGPDRTLTIFEWYFHDLDAARIARTLALSDEIQQEDIGVCESVQRGLRSISYERGRYSVKRENGLHHFHSLWRELMSNTSE